MATERPFSVVAYSSFFAVRHDPTGAEHPMGDGVDTMFNEDGEPLSPGDDGFVETWADSLNASAGETLEAYFPELAINLDSYVNPDEPREWAQNIPDIIPRGVQATLYQYAMTKADAMEHRLAGRIPEALRLESDCERIYNRLPEWARW